MDIERAMDMAMDIMERNTTWILTQTRLENVYGCGYQAWTWTFRIKQKYILSRNTSVMTS
jgi:hypothetical protein